MQYETYDGAYFAIACLRTALVELDRHIKQGQEEESYRRFCEICFFVREFYVRRQQARTHREIDTWH